MAGTAAVPKRSAHAHAGACSKHAACAARAKADARHRRWHRSSSPRVRRGDKATLADANVLEEAAAIDAADGDRVAERADLLAAEHAFARIWSVEPPRLALRLSLRFGSKGNAEIADLPPCMETFSPAACALFATSGTFSDRPVRDPAELPLKVAVRGEF